MQKEKKQYAGVCLDNTNAIIIAANEDEAAEYAIQGKVKANDHNSSGSEHGRHNAQQSDSLKYFKSLSSQLVNYDELLIFGPGKAQEQFQNFLKEDGQFNTTKVTIDSADNLTDPQMIAKVRDFYKSRQS